MRIISYGVLTFLSFGLAVTVSARQQRPSPVPTPASSAFQKMAELAFDSIDRVDDVCTHAGSVGRVCSEVLFGIVYGDAERDVQALRRATRSPQEQQIFKAIAKYWTQLANCRSAQDARQNDDYLKCLQETRRVRDEAAKATGQTSWPYLVHSFD
jgi:hypothetical protein